MKSMDLSAQKTWESMGHAFSEHEKADFGDASGGPPAAGAGEARMEEDVKNLALSMHITEAEARALLEEGLQVQVRATTDTFT
jgi:hypothetical protein